MDKITISAGKETTAARPINLCVVTSDIGLDAASESGIAIVTLARNRATAGHNVTLLWVRHPDRLVDAESAGEKETDKLRQFFLQAYSINLVPLPPSKALIPRQDTCILRSLEVYHYLSEQRFDIAYCALEGGLAYYALLAKETGVFVNSPQITIIAQSPTEWLSEADKFFLKDIQQVTAAYMEKYCVENCDDLISTSRSLLTWMRQNNWKVPEQAAAIPPILPDELKAQRESGAPSAGKIDEIVFLYGPDYHRGLTLLCDALDKAADRLPAGLTITMIGHFGKILGEHTGGMLLRRARNWPFKLKLLPHLTPTECLTYLHNRSALTVFPAYAASTNFWLAACIKAGLPLIATNVGSAAELVAESDRSLCLCELTDASLARKLIQAAQHGQLRAAPSEDLAGSEDKWRRHLDFADATNRAVPTASRKPDQEPLISVVLVHHERPHYLLQAVQSVERQDYRNLELILVDDGSQGIEAKSVLDQLEPGFKRRAWKILREQNRYLGAARNAGVRVARGTHILFLDDDNLLFPRAISTLVHAMFSSDADICTCFSKAFYGDASPPDDGGGYIQYVPLGDSLDVGFIENSFGDATALIRRDVFDKIGGQVELFGHTGEDWEFYARATLAGFKIRVVPQPLYWYRSSTRGMSRSSHWYDNRSPVVATFRRHNFNGVRNLHHLALATQVRRSEMESLRDNLYFSPSDAPFLDLCRHDPSSDEACALLARIAQSEGHPEAAQALAAKAGQEEQAAVPKLGPSPSVRARECSREELRSASLATPYPSVLPLMLFSHESGLFLRPSEMGPTVAALRNVFPPFARRVAGYVEIAHEDASPFEFAIALTRPDVPADWRGATPSDCLAFSGWKRVEEKFKLHEIELEMNRLIKFSPVVNLAVRLPPGSHPSPANAFWRRLVISWDERT
jgi:GT2 family glycosyltransferase